MFKQLGLIGCGLMGGSFALALKKAGLVEHVIGYSKSPSTVIQAQKLGVVDQAADSALLAVSGADIVLIAVPVAATEQMFRAIRHLVQPNALFMDAYVSAMFLPHTDTSLFPGTEALLRSRAGSAV